MGVDEAFIIQTKRFMPTANCFRVSDIATAVTFLDELNGILETLSPSFGWHLRQSQAEGQRKVPCFLLETKNVMGRAKVTCIEVRDYRAPSFTHRISRG